MKTTRQRLWLKMAQKARLAQDVFLLAFDCNEMKKATRAKNKHRAIVEYMTSL